MPEVLSSIEGRIYVTEADPANKFTAQGIVTTDRRKSNARISHY